MPQISIEDSDIPQLTKNSKNNNNIAGYHLVSCCVISATSHVQCVYRSPKRTFILPENYHVSVTSMLSQLLKCVIKTKLIHISETKPGNDPSQSAGSRTLSYPVSIMLQIFTENSVILQETENLETNSSYVGYHLVSPLVISTLFSLEFYKIKFFNKPLEIVFFQVLQFLYSNVNKFKRTQEKDFKCK